MSEEILPSKFLVIRLSSIGDIVLTTPVVRCLKQQVPGAEIHYLTRKNYAPLVQHNPYIDRVHLFDGELKILCKQLEAEQFDYIIDLHHNLRSYRIKSRLNALAFSFSKRNFEKWLLVNLRINRLPAVHIVDRYLDTLKLFDVNNDGKGLDFFIPKEDEVSLDLLPPEFRKGYIALATGALHHTKQIPLEMMQKLCNSIRFPVLLLGGKDDRSRSEELARLSPNCFNACGSFSINQSASLIRNALLIIAPDTGLMHIAAALKKNILSVWGNTIPGFGMAPYLPGKDSRIFEVENLSCRPCSKLGHQTCPKKHFRCMLDQSPEEIARTANTLASSALAGMTV